MHQLDHHLRPWLDSSQSNDVDTYFDYRAARARLSRQLWKDKLLLRLGLPMVDYYRDSFRGAVGDQLHELGRCWSL